MTFRAIFGNIRKYLYVLYQFLYITCIHVIFYVSSNLLPTEVVQIPSAVGRLGRLGPKLFPALARKRKLAQPGRLKVTDVALGVVTL